MYRAMKNSPDRENSARHYPVSRKGLPRQGEPLSSSNISTLLNFSHQQSARRTIQAHSESRPFYTDLGRYIILVSIIIKSEEQQG